VCPILIQNNKLSSLSITRFMISSVSKQLSIFETFENSNEVNSNYKTFTFATIDSCGVVGNS